MVIIYMGCPLSYDIIQLYANKLLAACHGYITLIDYVAMFIDIYKKPAT
jgi:hypothetical protein